MTLDDSIMRANIELIVKSNWQGDMPTSAILQLMVYLANWGIIQRSGMLIPRSSGEIKWRVNNLCVEVFRIAPVYKCDKMGSEKNRLKLRIGQPRNDIVKSRIWKHDAVCFCTPLCLGCWRGWLLPSWCWIQWSDRAKNIQILSPSCVFFFEHRRVQVSPLIEFLC